MADLSVATTILVQLGGNRFKVMTGAKNIIGSDDSLTFMLPTGFAKDSINKVSVTLDWTDTYVVEFGRAVFRPVPKYREIKKLTMVYAEDLQRMFTEVTGLNTHL